MSVSREIALEILVQQEIGSFIIRDSTTHPGCYALSVKVPKFENPTGISHYLIHRTKSGNFKLKVCSEEYIGTTMTLPTLLRNLFERSKYTRMLVGDVKTFTRFLRNELRFILSLSQDSLCGERKPLRLELNSSGTV